VNRTLVKIIQLSVWGIEKQVVQRNVAATANARLSVEAVAIDSVLLNFIADDSFSRI
jgi:hypothetical protein